MASLCGMKILPMVHAGLPILTEHGVELMPVQVIPNDDGSFEIRIGNNLLMFDKSGRYGGIEGKTVSADKGEAYQALLATDDQRRDHAPASSFYQPGTRGHAKETSRWPDQAPASETWPRPYRIGRN